MRQFLPNYKFPDFERCTRHTYRDTCRAPRTQDHCKIGGNDVHQKELKIFFRVQPHCCAVKGKFPCYACLPHMTIWQPQLPKIYQSPELKLFRPANLSCNAAPSGTIRTFSFDPQQGEISTPRWEQ